MKQLDLVYEFENEESLVFLVCKEIGKEHFILFDGNRFSVVRNQILKNTYTNNSDVVHNSLKKNLYKKFTNRKFKGNNEQLNNLLLKLIEKKL